MPQRVQTVTPKNDSRKLSHTERRKALTLDKILRDEAASDSPRVRVYASPTACKTSCR
jgi:hypothetical protein